jgi:hypothetical protein
MWRAPELPSEPLCLELWQCPSPTELLASLGKSPGEKKARISPFLDFLGGGEPKNSLSDQDSVALQNWVIQRFAKQMRLVKNPSLTTRRDSGLIAALCAAPAKEPLENGQKTASKSMAAKCFCGMRQSRNHASLSPCVSGMPGESGWPGRTSGGSTANFSYGASHDSFSPDPTAFP